MLLSTIGRTAALPPQTLLATTEDIHTGVRLSERGITIQPVVAEVGVSFSTVRADLHESGVAKRATCVRTRAVLDEHLRGVGAQGARSVTDLLDSPKRACHEVPDLRFHDLRHTSATLLLGQGVHPKIVQERLGHADIAMTLNCYSHVTSDMQRAAAGTLDAASREVRRVDRTAKGPPCPVTRFDTAS